MASVVYCEGYHDRSFWAGWLLRLNCSDPGTPLPGKTARQKLKDPWGDGVEGGQFGFISPSGKFVRVRPCDGKDRMMRFAEERLRQRQVKALERLVISVDADVLVDGTPAAPFRVPLASVEGMMQRVDPAFQRPPGGGFVTTDGAEVHFVQWSAPDPSTHGLPDHQSLERLVASAIVAAYPARGPQVQAWLDSCPGAPARGPKDFAWSHMAGWYAEHGCDNFFRHLWNDAAVATALEERLRASGAWAVAEALAQ
jgi:hypothetical protein